MSAIPLPLLKPKATLSAVQGRMTAVAEDGAKVGQWGGTECYLSREMGLGPALVVTTTSNKKKRTVFPLAKLHRVIAFHAAQGKMTVMLPHEHRKMVSLFIETTSDVEELRLMAAMLQDRSLWAMMERNVSKGGGKTVTTIRGGGGGRSSAGGTTTASPSAYLEEEAAEAYSDCGDDDDRYEEKARYAVAASGVHASSGGTGSGATNGAGFNLSSLAHGLKVQEEQEVLRELAALAATTVAMASVGHGDGSADGLTMPYSSSSSSSGKLQARCHVITSSSGLGTGAAPRGTSTAGASHNHVRRHRGTPQLDLVADAIARGGNVFLTGPPGTGKTALVLCLLDSIAQRRVDINNKERSSSGGALDVLAAKRITVTAATGHAARFLGGATLMDAFIGPTTATAVAGAAAATTPTTTTTAAAAVAERILSHRSLRGVLARWLHTDTIVIDDINQLPAHAFTLLSEVGRAVRRAAYEGGALPPPRGVTADATAAMLERPFGGLQLVVMGDFMAAPPPPQGMAVAAAGEEVLSAFASAAWEPSRLQCMWLMAPDSTNDDGGASGGGVRKSRGEAAGYRRCLEDLREGRYTLRVDDLVEACGERWRRYSATAAFAAKWGKSNNKSITGGGDLVPVEMVGSSAAAERINSRKLAELMGDDSSTSSSGNSGISTTAAVVAHRYDSEDYAAEPASADMDAETNPPSSLTLCVGAQVMLLASPPDGFPEAPSDGSNHHDISNSNPTRGGDRVHLAYGSVGVVVGFFGGATRCHASVAEQASPVVRFHTHDPLADTLPQDSGLGSVPAPVCPCVDVVVEAVSLCVYSDTGATVTSGSNDRQQQQLVLSRTQLPLRLAFALPMAALANTPMLPALRMRIDTRLFAAGGRANRNNGERGEQDDDDDEVNGEDGAEASGVALENQWGRVFAALSKVALPSNLYLDGLDRRVMAAAVNTAARDYYQSLFPLSAEEAQAAAATAAAEGVILDERRRQRKVLKRAEKKHKTVLPQERRKRGRDADATGATDAPSHRQEQRPFEQPLLKRRSEASEDDDGDADDLGLAATTENPTASDIGAHMGRTAADGSAGATLSDTAGESLRMPLLTQDSLFGPTTAAEMVERPQVRAIVRGLLMDDDDE